MLRFSKQNCVPAFYIISLIIFIFNSNIVAQTWYAQGDGGAVAAGKTARTADAGIQMLQNGGKAADAAAASLIVLAIDDYGMFCIGGEVPYIHYDADKEEVKVLSGQGRAPLDQTAINWLINNGIPEQYTNGNIKTAAVPAVIDLCIQSMKLWGSLTFEEIIEPALDILDNGSTSWYDDLAATLRKGRDAERNTSGTREEKLQAVSDRFYRGDIADALDSWYRNNGGLLRKKDLEEHVTNLEDPITVDYKGYTVCKCSTWTQGAVLLQTLQLLKEYDLEGMEHLSADYVHVIAEAMKLSFADRDEFYADPQFSEVPLANLLSDQYADIRRELIKMNRASDTIISGDPWNMKARNPDPHPNLKWPKGTTTLCVADQFGNVVSCTPSGWGSYAGSGGTTGMTHGTRLISSLTWDDHPNTIQPGMRPCITLTPTLVLKDGKPILAISVAGGDMQDQTSLNLFLDFVEFGQMPREAVRKPRFYTKHLTGFFHQPKPVLASLYINNTVPSSVRNELSSRGHKVSSQSGAIGNPVMIYIDQSDGMLYAAGDPDASNRNVKAYDKPVGIKKPQYLNPLQNISVNSMFGQVEIKYWISEKEDVDLSIYNVKGSLVQRLKPAEQLGKHVTVWYCEDISQGCYIVKLTQSGNVATRKLFLN